MNLRQIKETCLYMRDLEQARAFYHGLLGLPVIHYVPDKHIFFRAGPSVLLCFNPDDSRLKTSPPGHFSEGKYHFAFEIPAHEYEEHKRQLRARGIVITDEVTWANGMQSVYFEDPAGNVLELVPEGVWE
ncbi:MAG: VOC family protein [Cyclobacteriaceae bacterium]|jgi:catechol 2,3-dioxygenase-like lactoylglutathione lyase family enzyme|nr:VOC family protein [Cyclobacteriaceae bacterium]